MDLALTRRGGYRLTRPPGEVALLEVVEAAEGFFTANPQASARPEARAEIRA